jgi:predicted hydrocarbon binding protein
MAERHGTTPDQIGAERFPTELARFFADLGWGSLTFGTMGTVATLDSSDWAEGNPAHPMEFPACYFTAGLLTELFMRLSDVPVSALEVECRSAGAERCRFLVGSSETIQRVYDGLSAGVGYEANV